MGALDHVPCPATINGLPDANCREWFRDEVTRIIRAENQALKEEVKALSGKVDQLNDSMMKMAAAASMATGHARTLYGDDGRTGLVGEVSEAKGRIAVTAAVAGFVAALFFALLVPIGAEVIRMHDHVAIEQDKDHGK
jgi:hypothetical protein